MSNNSVRLNVESLGERVMPSVSPIAVSNQVDTAQAVTVGSEAPSTQAAQPAYIEKWFLG